MINSIQFCVNMIAFAFCLLFRNADVSGFINKVLILIIPLNVLTLFIFSYFFILEYEDEKEERDMLISIELERRELKEIHSRLVINEGRYILYFIWGASISSN